MIIDKKPALNDKLFARSNNKHETFIAAQTRIDTRVDGYVNTTAAPSRYFLRSR